jgi:hypothetical protein
MWVSGGDLEAADGWSTIGPCHGPGRDADVVPTTLSTESNESLEQPIRHDGGGCLHLQLGQKQTRESSKGGVDSRGCISVVRSPHMAWAP